MKRPLIIANWKSHKTVDQVEKWFEEVASDMAFSQAEVVLCPSFPYLSLCKDLVKRHGFSWKLGAQDVSFLPEGKYTGEVNAVQLKDFVDYVLIGHSERREALKETDEILFEKVKRAQEAGLKPIFFVQSKETALPQAIDIVAFEPVFAIGTGNPDTPDHAEEVARYFKSIKHIQTVLYGGSVDYMNISLFLTSPSLDGVVPGTASLDPKEFVQLINNA